MMIPFSSMSSIFCGAVGIWIAVLFFGFSLLETFAVMAKQKPHCYLNILILAALYSMLQFVLWLTTADAPAESFPIVVRNFVTLPCCVILLLCAAFTLLLATLTVQCRRWQNENITNMSVKYAVDAFPEGICCYGNSGMVLLENRAMENFSRLTCGESVKNGTAFYEKLRSGKLLPGCEVKMADETHLLVAASGKAFSVTKNLMNHGGETLNFIVAADISEEYYKTEELMLRQDQVSRLNEKLKSYNKKISTVISARETLNAKVKIHDELGLGLLAAKRYILSGGTEAEKQAIVDSLKQQIRYLRSDREEEENDEYAQLLLAANDLKITVKQEGTLPADAAAKHIFVTAIHECLTNTIRHAHGDTVYVKLYETQYSYKEQISNNGEKPSGPITEKDGLTSLREMVRAQGGNMNENTDDGFTLEIVLPKEGLDEIQSFGRG